MHDDRLQLTAAQAFEGVRTASRLRGIDFN